ARDAQIVESNQRDDRTGNTAGGEPSDDAPVDRPIVSVDGAADRLRYRSEKLIGADSSDGREAENKYQDRCHERAAADARQDDKEAYERAGECVEPGDVIEHSCLFLREGRGPVSGRAFSV